ncbi:hypothetical protein SEA_CASSEROLE_56 [Arthrobacter phage Casserole]|nr:hypothetical protein SEA_CASSEROLE_2 [Arthrobacter phage Casserole]USL89138.1 hypothetical protein SEA_CASSEROLE_56 [Arthrobacter phage Casserole]
MSYISESKVIRSESFSSNIAGIVTAEVELWLDMISETECEYNVRTKVYKAEQQRSKFVSSVIQTVESHHSMKAAIQTYNDELYQLGDPEVEAHKASY